MAKKLVDGETDVLRNLPQESGRDIPALVKGHSRTSATGTSKLLVGATLPYLHEAKSHQNCNDLCRFEDRDVSH